MATMRQIDTRFWTDTWVRKLNALDRYAFIYFLTNTHSSWCGVYELDISMAAFESGIDEHDLEKSILPRLSPKIIFIDGWVYIKNFQKYHENKSEQTKKGIENAWNIVPIEIRLKIEEIEGLDIPPIDPLVGASPSSSSSSSSLSPKGKLSNDSVPSKTLSNYRDLRRKQLGKEPMEKKKATLKQKSAFSSMMLIDYFRDKVMELHRKSYLFRKEDKNPQIRKQAKSCVNRYGDKSKDYVNWFLTEGDNAWTKYEPTHCFSSKFYQLYDNFLITPTTGGILGYGEN